MGSAKRERKRAKREARAEAELQIPALTDADFEELLTSTTVRADCQHASTRTTTDGPVLTRCAVGAAVGGGCPHDCAQFERRRVGGLGLGGG